MAISAQKVETTTIPSVSSYPYTVKVTFTESSTSTANNTSTIKITGSIGGSAASWSSSSSSTLKIYWHDNNKNTSDKLVASTSFSSMSANATKSVSSSITVTHKSDGSLSGYAKVVFTSHGTSYEPGSKTATTSTTALTTIPRASTPTLSASSASFGGSVTISTNRASTSFTHTLKYSVGTMSGTIATSVASSKTWNIPLSLASAIPNATSGTCTITCITYNSSGTSIGSKTVTLKLTVPSSVIPTITSISVSEANTDVSNKNISLYLKGLSRLLISVSASGAQGSSIASYSITANGETLTSNGISTSTLVESGSQPITCVVTDSRGRKSAAFTQMVNVYDYQKPKAMINEFYRCDENGNEQDDGTYVYINYTATYDTLNGTYTGTTTRNYKRSSAATYTSASITPGANQALLLSGYDVDLSYNYYLQSSDAFYTITSGTVLVDSSFSLIDFGKDGKSIKIGGASERINTFVIDKDFIFVAEGDCEGVVSSRVAGQDGNHNMGLSWNGQEYLLRVDDTTHVLHPKAMDCYKAGDTITYDVHTAGYITSSGKSCRFTVPLGKPISGNLTVTATSVTGFMCRQNGSYLYDGNSSTRVKPTSYTCSIKDNYIVIYATFSNNTNAINNESVGIAWYGTVTLS